MTTTASKHGLKKAAAARTAKHAQRTPLPPKRERVIAEEAGLVSRRAEERKAALTGNTLNGEGKSSAKARAFAEEISKNGWSPNPNFVSPEHVQLTARRGTESLFIEWVNGVYQPTATYAINDRVIKMRNASQAKQYAARTPDQATAELDKVSSNRFFRKRETPEGDLVRKPLPFDPALATDEEVLTALTGRRVTWHNRFREVSETAIFPRRIDPRFTRITTGESGERSVHFLCPATGFRSFRLGALLQISRGTAAAVARENDAEHRKAAKKVKS